MCRHGVMAASFSFIPVRALTSAQFDLIPPFFSHPPPEKPASRLSPILLRGLAIRKRAVTCLQLHEADSLFVRREYTLARQLFSLSMLQVLASEIPPAILKRGHLFFFNSSSPFLQVSSFSLLWFRDDSLPPSCREEEHGVLFLPPKFPLPPKDLDAPPGNFLDFTDFRGRLQSLRLPGRRFSPPVSSSSKRLQISRPPRRPPAPPSRNPPPPPLLVDGAAVHRLGCAVLIGAHCLFLRRCRRRK